MSDNRQSLSDLAELTGQQAAQPAPAPEATEAPAEAAAPPPPARVEAPLREQQLDKFGRAYATGRRKDAVARVWLKPGSGRIEVNGRDQETYFAIVQGYVDAIGIKIDQAQLRAEANEWSVTRGARSGRVAWQFIQDLAGRLGHKLEL